MCLALTGRDARSHVIPRAALSGLKRRKKEMNHDGPRLPRALPWALPCEPFRLGLVSGDSTIFLTGRRAKGFDPFSLKG
jgi:hypothetical protein